MENLSKYQKSLMRFYKKNGFDFFMICSSYREALEFAIQYENQITVKSFDNVLMFTNEEDLNVAKLIL